VRANPPNNYLLGAKLNLGEVQAMLETLEFARQVFETRVAPLLQKWGLSVVPVEQRKPYEVEWKLGEKGGLRVKLLVDRNCCGLLFFGGISRPMIRLGEKPLTASDILSKLKYAVEAEIVWQCRQQLAKLFATTRAIAFYPQARLLEWEVRGGKFYYICSFSISIQKATWRWNCEVYPLKNTGVPDYEKGFSFQLTPTDKELNPVSALLEVAKLSIAEALL
jgi:hypothetical protein